MAEHLSSMRRYLERRELARRQAERDFTERHPDLIELLAVGNEYLSSCMHSICGKDFRQLPHGLYASDLIISFVRTYFTTIDLLGQGELIEAAVLTRKQIELLARLHELSGSQSFDRLIRKTPNVKGLTTKMRQLYSAYSELSHSTNPIHLQQLGQVADDEHIWTCVYPQYSENSAITFQHILLSLVEFHSWAGPYLINILSDNDYAEFEDNFLKFAGEFIRIYPSAESGHV